MCGKDEVFALVKDSLKEAITMEGFEKSLELLQGSHSIKCNIISNRTYLFILNHISIPKVSTQNTSSIINDFEDFKSNFIENIKRTNRTFYEPTERIIFYRNDNEL